MYHEMNAKWFYLLLYSVALRTQLLSITVKPRFKTTPKLRPLHY